MIKFDADNQHKISDLFKILRLLKKNNIEFCKGYRDLKFKASLKRRMPLIRIIGASSLTYISRLTTKNFTLKDVTNGLFGIKSNILNKIDLKNIKENYFLSKT